MGTIKKGILGGVSGKVGNVVGANWKGIDYLRVLPSSVSNPNTVMQATQRLKFAIVGRFLQPVTEFIRVGFRAWAIKMSAYNAAFSYNYHNALSGEFPDFGLDYSKVLVSRGNLPAAVNPVVSSVNPAIIQLNWESNTGQGPALDSDLAMVVVFNPESGEAVYLTEVATRQDLTAEIEVPVSFSGVNVHCYLAFRSAGITSPASSKNAVSNSVWAGEVLVA